MRNAPAPQRHAASSAAPAPGKPYPTPPAPRAAAARSERPKHAVERAAPTPPPLITAMALRRGVLRGTGLLASRALLSPACQQGLLISPALHTLSLLADSCRDARPPLRQTLFIDDPSRWVQLLHRHHFGADAKQQQARSPSPSIPDAQQCDSAIETYEKLRTKYDEAIWEPPLPKNAAQRVKDAWALLLKALIATKDFALKVPGWARTLSSMSREEWSTWWAGAWKTIKHEAHHYWVRGVAWRGGLGAWRRPPCCRRAAGQPAGRQPPGVQGAAAAAGRGLQPPRRAPAALMQLQVAGRVAAGAAAAWLAAAAPTRPAPSRRRRWAPSCWRTTCGSPPGWRSRRRRARP
jgi:hypothetical protein